MKAYTPPASPPDAQAYGPVQQAAVLAAVRDDVRQTLRCGWIDPAIEAAAAQPIFFTAAWSAIRPNVGKSFLSLARALRTEAADWVRATMDPPDLRKRLERVVSEEELRRIEESARAAHQAMAKVHIVVHAVYRALRRERIGGTGREEPPVRRGVPESQRWMSFQPASDAARGLLDRSARALGVPAAPAPLRLFARWPAALQCVWDGLQQFADSEHRPAAAIRLRRKVLAGIATLPHPVELQWMALKERGFGEEERVRLAEEMAAHDAAMPEQTLLAAFCWLSLGAPEIGAEA